MSKPAASKASRSRLTVLRWRDLRASSLAMSACSSSSVWPVRVRSRSCSSLCWRMSCSLRGMGVFSKGRSAAHACEYLLEQLRGHEYCGPDIKQNKADDLPFRIFSKAITLHRNKRDTFRNEAAGHYNGAGQNEKRAH